MVWSWGRDKADKKEERKRDYRKAREAGYSCKIAARIRDWRESNVESTCLLKPLIGLDDLERYTKEHGN